MVPLRARAIPTVALLAAACTVQFRTEGAYDESFDLGESGELTITGLAGDVAISGWDAHRVAMRGISSAVGASPAKARANLDYAVLTAARGPAELILSFEPPASRVGLVDLVLDRGSKVPRGARLTIDTGYGDLAVSGVEGDLDLETGSGDISVKGAEGDVVAVSDTGDVAVESVAYGGVTVRTGGDVSVESHGGMDIDAGGAADVASLGGGEGTIRVTTSGSSITFAIESGGDFEIICHPDGGSLSVDPALSASVEERPGGEVAVTRGHGGRSVALISQGGGISIEALAATTIAQLSVSRERPAGVWRTRCPRSRGCARGRARRGPRRSA
ncbi:MAG: hypothetical protein PHU25_00195 [Deltaproteobacteria bacterium]|nr:hypothetical protein [Deltaproteobacteria bacterium]